MTADELLDAAQARINSDGYDPATVLGAALEYLAESWANEDRMLCPSCGRRRIHRSRSECLWCEQTREAQLLHKRKWWAAHGQANRVARRDEARIATTEQDHGVISTPAIDHR